MTYITNEKLDCIAKYLLEKTGCIGVEQCYDRERAAQSFKVYTEIGPHLLKVGDRFIADNSTGDMTRWFEVWSLSERLMHETKRGLLVTSYGPEPFELV
jgi:hypothetical protein